MLNAPVTRKQIQGSSIDSKIKAGQKVIEELFKEYDPEDIVIGFTGGKDSTLVAWLVKKVCEQEDIPKPRLMFIDHGQHFQDVKEYVDDIAQSWGFEKIVVRNDDLIDKADKPGDKVSVKQLNERNKDELKRLGDYKQVEWLMDTKTGNHLLKTVPMKEYIEKNNIKAVINGVRWDEHDSRSNEDFYSPRSTPDHLRVHPILQFNEKEVWQATWFKIVSDIAKVELKEMPETPDELPEEAEAISLPINPKYWEGFRSLGSEVSTEKSGEQPAWTQDLDSTDERGGRAQNKDEKDVMEELRKHGYM